MRNVILLVVILLVAGCGFKSGDVHEAAKDTTVPYSGSNLLKPAENAEEVLQEAFRRDMGVPWLPGEAKLASGHLDAINYMFQHMKDTRNVDGNLPYYTYRTGFEFIRKNYLQLEPILDRRAAQGVLSKAEKVVYETTKRDIKLKLEFELQRLKSAEKAIEEDVTANMVDGIQRTYEILKPIIGLL